ncbi:hypothetical protein INR49_026741 [Caranx melampygus]|nr:hypothetical protein INR49_026741 [Caranx melampygus]
MQHVVEIYEIEEKSVRETIHHCFLLLVTVVTSVLLRLNVVKTLKSTRHQSTFTSPPLHHFTSECFVFRRQLRSSFCSFHSVVCPVNSVGGLSCLRSTPKQTCELVKPQSPRSHEPVNMFKRKISPLDDATTQQGGATIITASLRNHDDRRRYGDRR